jgi:uncharacterized protein (TIGR02246 family)
MRGDPESLQRRNHADDGASILSFATGHGSSTRANSYQRDARAVAGLFSPSGDYVFFDSPLIVGRDSIEKASEAISGWPSTRRFSLEVTSIRFLGSDLALIETLARFSEGEMTSNRGTALMTRRDGKWFWEALRVYPAQRS